MDTKKILSDLRAEFERINQAIAALESLSDTGVSRAEAVYKAAAEITPKPRSYECSRSQAHFQGCESKVGSETQQESHARSETSPSGGRKMSAAARKRISEMMKKRWAERRKKAAKTA